MNYAIVVCGGVWAFAVAYWYFPKIGGKTFFRSGGPHERSFNILTNRGPVTTEPDEVDYAGNVRSKNAPNSAVRVVEVDDDK